MGRSEKKAARDASLCNPALFSFRTRPYERPHPLQSLHYIADDGADGGPYEPGSEFAFVQVRERPAVIGTCLIDGAILVVEKTAGPVLKHIPITLLGQPEVLSDQLGFLNAHMTGQPPYIFVGEQWRDDGAAVRTGAAIDAARHILQVPPDEAVEVSPRQVEAFEIYPEAPVLVFLRFGERLDPLDIHGCRVQSLRSRGGDKTTPE
jgi:hypothetical protein